MNKHQEQAAQYGISIERQVLITMELEMALFSIRKHLGQRAQALWKSSLIVGWDKRIQHWQSMPFSGAITLVGSVVMTTLLIWGLDHFVVVLPNPGVIYLPFVAMLAYHWGTRYAIVATLLQLLCVYVFFLSPPALVKPLTAQNGAQLITLAGVTGFVLALVELARERRAAAEHEAARSSALNRVGAALTSELDEDRLLHLVAQTARDLTGAQFAAFTLRPIDELGQPLGPSEGSLFHLASVVGVTHEQEQLLRHMHLGGEGLLAPIFRQGVPVRVSDALALMQDVRPLSHTTGAATPHTPKEVARQAAFDYAHGSLLKDGLQALGVPRGHPLIRSFLGVPLLNHNRQVIGGLLLGDSAIGQFTPEDEALLIGLSAQTTIALENARLYHTAHMRAQELDATFESIADGVTLLDAQGHILRENSTAHRLRAWLSATAHGCQDLEQLLYVPARSALQGHTEQDIAVTILDENNETRDYIVNASRLHLPARPSLRTQESRAEFDQTEWDVSSVVVVWHDVTEGRRLLVERTIHAETELQRALLQAILDELPSSVYLVHGDDARLILANRASTALWGATWHPEQPMSEFLAQNQLRLSRIDNRPLPLSEFAPLRAVQLGETISHQQEVIRYADGTTLPVLISAVALHIDHLRLSPLSSPSPVPGTPERAALVVCQDVSALKEAERLKDDFIGIAAHELRTPVAVVKGYAQMLQIQTARGKGPALADWQTEALQSIDQATVRLVELIEDLLDVTRLQAGRLALRIEPIDLVALAKRVINRLQVTTEQHTLTVDTTQPSLVIAADRRRLEQVLSNLISNAIKYSPEGGAVELHISEDSQQEKGLLCVHDHGIGIPQDQQVHIFERFVRANNARAYGIGGTGLGLYLCRELVERIDGHIWFASSENQGSTFFLALPLYKEQADA